MKHGPARHTPWGFTCPSCPPRHTCGPCCPSTVGYPQRRSVQAAQSVSGHTEDTHHALQGHKNRYDHKQRVPSTLGNSTHTLSCSKEAPLSKAGPQSCPSCCHGDTRVGVWWAKLLCLSVRCQKEGTGQRAMSHQTKVPGQGSHCKSRYNSARARCHNTTACVLMGHKGWPKKTNKNMHTTPNMDSFTSLTVLSYTTWRDKGKRYSPWHCYRHTDVPTPPLPNTPDNYG